MEKLAIEPGLNPLAIAKFAKSVGKKYVVVFIGQGKRWLDTYWFDLEAAESEMFHLVNDQGVDIDQVRVIDIDEYVKILYRDHKD